MSFQRIVGKKLICAATKVHSINKTPYNILYSNEGLSFWGGINENTGVVIDHTHSLFNKCIANKALVIPSSRGSCTGSQVVLELILNKVAPSIIVTEGDACDEHLITGCVIAEELKLADKKPQEADLEIPMIVSTTQFKELEYSEYLFIEPHTNLKINNALEEVLLFHGNSSTSSIQQNSSETEFCYYHLLKPRTVLDLCERIMTRASLASSSSVSEKSLDFIAITNAHIDSCTYIGQGGIQFIKMLVNDYNANVSVPTTLNSISTDLYHSHLKKATDDENHFENSKELADSYLKLKADLSFTCAPYHLVQSNSLKQKSIAWGESNAVIYANSILGAYTNKYPDFIEVCASILGKVPKVGMYLEENRCFTKIINLFPLAKELNFASRLDSSFFALLGYAIGLRVPKDDIPMIIGFGALLQNTQDNFSNDDAKALCAAFATTSSLPMFHIANYTPEALEIDEFELLENKECEVLSIADLKDCFMILDKEEENISNATVDLVAFGNPHFSSSEITKVHSLLHNKTKYADTKVIITTSRYVLQRMDSHIIQDLKEFGISFIVDTCWCMLTKATVPAPKEEYTRIMTNSGKYAHYAPGLVQRKVRFGSLYMCCQAAINGSAKRDFWSFLHS